MDDYGRRMIGPLTIDKSSGSYVDARAYGTLGTQAAIAAALADIGADERTLYLAPGTWSITSNLATLANVNIRAERGAVLAIATGVTLTINGTLDAGLYQIFSCTGTGKVAGLSWGYSEWWGGLGDNSTDCTAAIASLFEATNIWKVNVGTYKHTGINLGTNQRIVGEGFRNSILDYTAATGDGITLTPTTGKSRRNSINGVYLYSSANSTVLP